MREATFVMSGADLLTLKSPIVYGWFRDEQALYVGMSAHGLQRALSRWHKALDPEKVLPKDSLYIWICRTEAEAASLERELIGSTKPLFNTAGPNPSSSPSTPVRLRAKRDFTSATWAQLRGRPLKSSVVMRPGPAKLREAISRLSHRGVTP